MKTLSVKSWVHERILFLALGIFVLGATVYIGADKILGLGSVWLHPIKEFSLLVSMIGVVSLGYELFLRELTFKQYKDALEEIVNPDAVRLGIKGLYKNRSELGRAQSFESLFKNVKREIFIGGTSLLSIATSSRDLLRGKVLDGITIKLLIMDPNSKVVELITSQAGGKPTFKNEIKTALLLLQKLQDEVESETGSGKKGKLLIHVYDMIPSHSFISVDQEEPNAIMVADLGPYLGRNLPRPSMVVVKKRGGMFEYWQQLNNAMWAESKPPQQDDAAMMDSKTKTLLFVSGKETEYHDGQTNTWGLASFCVMDPRWRGIKGSQWIWVRESVTLEEAKTGSQNKFRVKFNIPSGNAGSIIRADLFVRSEDYCRIAVNDVGLVQKYGGARYPDPFIIDIGKLIKAGDNVLAFEVNNTAKPTAASPEDNPTGLIYRLLVEYGE